MKPSDPMHLVAYRYLRRKASEYGLYPDSRLGRLAVAFLVVDLALVVVQRTLLLWQRTAIAGLDLAPWISFVTFILIVLAAWLTLRWVRQRLLWRLRNRLIVTYVFIGLIPVLLLLAIGGLAGWLFAGQFGTYLMTSELRSETRTLHALRTSMEHQLRADNKVATGTLSAIGE